MNSVNYICIMWAGVSLCWWIGKTQNEDIVVLPRVKTQKLFPNTEENLYHSHPSLPSIGIQTRGLQNTK
jgi:hypothetical protein